MQQPPNVKKEVSREHPLRRYLFRVTASSFETVGLADRELIRYVTDVLVDFAHVDNIYRFQDEPGKRRIGRLADMIGQLEEAGRRGVWPEPEIRKHIGDSCLFFTGIYPEHLERDARWVDFRPFVRLGVDSYRWVSDFEAVGPSAALFRKLSSAFEDCVGALHIEREFLLDPFYQYLLRQMDW
ncbi:MAG: hypothetical protein ACE5JS_10740 [Nitrospinota bacterium]